MLRRGGGMDQVHLLFRLLSLPQAIHARGVYLGVGMVRFFSISLHAGWGLPTV